MASLNKVMLIGNLTRDPELRHTPKGTSVADLGLAVNRKVQDGNGGWKDETTFVDVTVWGSAADNAGKYLQKGRPIFVEGRIQMETWDDKETGQKRSRLKIVGENIQFLPSSQKATAGTSPASNNQQQPIDQSDIMGNQDDEDIPF